MPGDTGVPGGTHAVGLGTDDIGAVVVVVVVGADVVGADCGTDGAGVGVDKFDAPADVVRLLSLGFLPGFGLGGRTQCLLVLITRPLREPL